MQSTRRFYFFVSLCLTLLLATACANSTVVTGSDKQTAASTQSETDAVTAQNGNANLIIVAYNDETSDQHLITYTQYDRAIKSGASLMGWSYSENGGTNWSYGGKVTPPKGWSVLWGDPAITTDGAAYNVVFMSNLAMPSSKFPKGGIHGYVYYGDGKSAYVGGACIVKSSDAGKSFVFYQCVSNKTPIPGIPDTPQGHFYDGGSMASNGAGEIFAAYTDVAADSIDVYRSPNASGTFQRISDPFPNLVMASHPLLRTASDNSLYVAAQAKGSDGNYYIYMNKYANGAWGSPVEVSSYPSVLYPNVDLETSTLGSELTVRTAEQFGFAIGTPSAGGNDAIRLLYTRYDGNHFYIDAVVCRSDLTNCGEVPGWRFQGGGPRGSAVDDYNPDVTAWVGFIGLPPTWQASWVYHYGHVNTVNVARATLGYDNNGNGFIFPIDTIKDAEVCSDTRGYWGDYDAMILTGFSGSSSLWMHFLTSSAPGCSRRWEFTASSQHIQESNYSY
jgi:hypothetical protein